MTRRVVLALLARSRCSLRPRTPRPGRARRQGLPGSFTPEDRACDPEREARDRDLPPRRQGGRLARPLPEQGPRHRRDLRQGSARLAGRRLVELGRRDRDGTRRRRDGRRHRGLDRAAGRLEDGPRRERRLRRARDQQPPDLARPVRDLPDRARRLPQAADDAEPRPRRAALVLGLAVVLQPRRHLHGRPARVSADGLPARADGLVGVARRARARAAGVAGLAARLGDGLPRRVPHRPERAQLERDRRRLLGRDRGRIGSCTGSPRTGTCRARGA